ncbi:hypothetical protein FSARC_13369 [Fusarium sarcochroum]|uniref:Uncharacterized protein n=1 Tax=Fusarium sarcochroum TaxID=1208366 RepID=A0A8H4T1U7_9HYPO|nr:hypothetical protein FSARC_13369 [Fusarium sarcochroum]
MEHDDIIAYLYPHGLGDVGGAALESIEANSRHMPPRLKHTRRQWELIDSLESLHSWALDYLPHLVVRSSDAPKTSKGLLFGSNARCDVHLQRLGVSNVHFSLTFDKEYRAIISDMNSTRGTQVTYDGKNKGIRRDFSWIVGGHDLPQYADSIIISIPGAVAFQIVVEYHHKTSPEYIARVDRFNRGLGTDETLLHGLRLKCPPMAPPNTPCTEDMILKKKLGEGSFGVVAYVCNIRTGDERAIKSPSSNAIRKGMVDYGAWQQEAHIMGQVKHPHIIELIDSFTSPQPELHFEFMRHGSLASQDGITYKETCMIVRKCSSALEYLHGLEPPIAHREIKPANILVEHRTQESIYVKLGDFGLSQHLSELFTICGTTLYLAPEIRSEELRRSRNERTLGYTTAVDVWSLGVVACELLYGLPRHTTQHENDGTVWCQRIVGALQKDVRRDPTMLGSMLVDWYVQAEVGDSQILRGARQGGGSDISPGGYEALAEAAYVLQSLGQDAGAEYSSSR